MDYHLKIRVLRNSPLGEDEYEYLESYDNDIIGPYNYTLYREGALDVLINKFETNSFESFLKELADKVRNLRSEKNKVKITFNLKTYDEENVKQKPKLTREQKLEETINGLLQE